MKKIILSIISIFALISCNRPEPNYEGVLMTDYGRNGIESFTVVTGAQGPLGPGSELYQVPMFEQKSDVDAVQVSARDAGMFTVDPTYTYQVTRMKGPNIILNYKHLGTGEGFLDNVEANVLDKLAIDAYREEARNYTTDSLMNNLGSFERNVEEKLKLKFATKFFTLNTLTSGLTPPKSMADAIEKRNNGYKKPMRLEMNSKLQKCYWKKPELTLKPIAYNLLDLRKKSCNSNGLKQLEIHATKLSLQMAKRQ